MANRRDMHHVALKNKPRIIERHHDVLLRNDFEELLELLKPAQRELLEMWLQPHHTYLSVAKELDMDYQNVRLGIGVIMNIMRRKIGALGCRTQ